jgi:electron transfer flavoprotein alpha subunit
MTILVVLELDRGDVTASSLEAVGMAQQLVDELACPVQSVWLSDGRTPGSGSERTHGGSGSSEVTHGGPSVVGAALAGLVGELEPIAVIAAATDYGMEVMAHLAAHTGLPLVNNCTAIQAASVRQASPGRAHDKLPHGGYGIDKEAYGGPKSATRKLVAKAADFALDQQAWWTVTRVRGGGVLLEDAQLVASTKLLTVAPGAVSPVDAADIPDPVELPATVGDQNGVRLVERTTAGGGVTLANAPVVVSGGRGVGSAEGFAVLEELAELLGGAVGCSRVATNNGWRPHSDQVGQTGTKVAPDLYIAAGISGATQHWAGCMNAKTILAVNTDPEAPMMTRADYAVIGDVHDVLSAVVDELQRRATARLASPPSAQLE